MKIFAKRNILLLLSLVLLATIGIASTYAWFAGTLESGKSGNEITIEDGETPLSHSPTVTMGTVEIKLTNSTFNRDNNNNSGSFTIANSSTIDIAVRVGLIPYWVDSDGTPTIADTSGISFTTETNNSENWDAVESDDGKWFIVYVGGIEGIGIIKPSQKTVLCSSYTATFPGGYIAPEGLTLRVDVVAEAIQGTNKAIEDIWGDINTEGVYTDEK